MDFQWLQEISGKLNKSEFRTTISRATDKHPLQASHEGVRTPCTTHLMNQRTICLFAQMHDVCADDFEALQRVWDKYWVGGGGSYPGSVSISVHATFMF